LIYVYRPAEFQGAAAGLDVYADDAPFVVVQNGQFISAPIHPGHHVFRSKTIGIDKATPIDVEAGKTYFLSFGIRSGVWVNTLVLTQVTPEYAVREMQECCKSGVDQ
jgi:hypothetical protein